jgi:dTDP-4-amino-4,6-dideoxygalactose transaminase
LPFVLASFRRVASTYQRRLDALGLGGRLLVAPSVASCYALFRCRHAAETSCVLDSLARSHIESRFWYGQGLHRQPYYAGVLRDALPFTESIAPLVIALPVAPDLPEAAIERVALALRRGTAA